MKQEHFLLNHFRKVPVPFLQTVLEFLLTFDFPNLVLIGQTSMCVFFLLLYQQMEFLIPPFRLYLLF